MRVNGNGGRMGSIAVYGGDCPNPNPAGDRACTDPQI